MAPQPTSCKGAEGHHDFSGPAGPVDGCLHESAARAVTLQWRGHSGVHEHKMAMLGPEDELGFAIACVEHEARLAGLFHHGHDTVPLLAALVTAPAPGGGLHRCGYPESLPPAQAS